MEMLLPEEMKAALFQLCALSHFVPPVHKNTTKTHYVLTLGLPMLRWGWGNRKGVVTLLFMSKLQCIQSAVPGGFLFP